MFSANFSWGQIVKVDLDKKKVDEIIKDYVDKKYPDKVKSYHRLLMEQKSKMIDEISDLIFIHNGLMWQDSEVNTKLKLNSLEMKHYCKKLNFANRKDWRVPTLSELITLVDYTKTKPAVLDKINHTESKPYWSSSVNLNDKNKYWVVDFRYGETDIASKLQKYNIRCVRELSNKQGEY